MEHQVQDQLLCKVILKVRLEIIFSLFLTPYVFDADKNGARWIRICQLERSYAKNASRYEFSINPPIFGWDTTSMDSFANGWCFLKENSIWSCYILLRTWDLLGLLLSPEKKIKVTKNISPIYTLFLVNKNNIINNKLI